MPLASDIISVDTLQIKPVEAAFQRGELMMSAGPAPSLDSGVMELSWGSHYINMILVFVAVVIFIMQMRRIFRIFPYLLEGLWRSKKLIDLEDGVRLIRDRNSLVINAFLIMSLITSGYNLYHPDFIAGYQSGIRTLFIMGVFGIFLLFRHLMIVGMSRYRLEGEIYQLNNRIGNDYLILLTFIVLLVSGILSVFHVQPEVVRIVLYYVLAVVYALYLFRRWQILTSSCAQLPAILYLCILEILPAGLLVASEILF